MEGGTEALTERIMRCMNDLHRLLLPPFTTLPAKDFVSALQTEIGADAVALFVRSSEAPNILRLAAGVGYSTDYADYEYDINGEFLTSKVYLQNKALNASLSGLKKKKYGPLPLSGRCERFIETGQFYNIIAAPVALSEKERPDGILKIENKKDIAKLACREDEEFPEDDFALAKILALFLAVAYRQRKFAQLWREAEMARQKHRSPEHFLASVSCLLAQCIHAESAGVFIKTVESTSGMTESERPVFRYAGGFGYKGHVASQRFLAIGNSFVAEVARIQLPTILKDCTRYSELSADWVESGEIRSALGIPLIDKAQCIGVVLVQNKLPDGHFDRHDQDLSKAFVDQQIVPALRELDARNRPAETDGYSLLCRSHLGPPQKLKGDALVSRVKAVERIRRQCKGQITIADCARYVRVAESYYFRLKQQGAPGRATR